MKLKITYIPSEEPEAAAVVAAIRQLYPGIKVHKSEAHPPYRHIYLTTRKPAKP